MPCLRFAVAILLFVQTACVVALKPPKQAQTARKVEGSYGTSLMKLEEFSVTGAAADDQGLTMRAGAFSANDEKSTSRFTVMRGNKPFVRLTCTAGSDTAVARMGSLKLNHPPFWVTCDGDGFSLRMRGNPERPLSGVATWRGEEFRVKTLFETEDQGESAHLGFVVEAADGWVGTADIQGTTWIAQPLREEAREALVLANFGWASRRRVITAEASGIIINRN